MSKVRSLVYPRPVAPSQVKPDMIAFRRLFYLDSTGDYYPVTSVTPVRETRVTEDYGLYPVTTGYHVECEHAASIITNAFGEDDTPLFLDQMPVVGMGATMLYPDDRFPCTVTEVVDENEITVQEDKVVHLSGNFQSGNVKWESTPDPQGQIHTLKYRSGKGWRSISGQYFSIGSRDYHISPEV